MLKVNMKPKKIEKVPQTKDTIVNKVHYESTYDKDGNKITKRVVEKVNITKKVNETAKILKTMTAEEKIASIQQTLKE